jgi:NAD(P)H-hydrate epimerase
MAELGGNAVFVSLTHDGDYAAAHVGSAARSMPGPREAPREDRHVGRDATVDRETVDTYGIPVLLLMELAGMGVVRERERRFGDLAGRSIVIAAGTGHNGGDGLVAARHLLQRGAHVRVFLAFPAPAMQGEAKTQAEIVRRLGGSILDPSAFDRAAFRSALDDADLAIDALVGTGLSSLSGFLAELVGDLNAARVPVVAVDSRPASAPILERS